MGEVHRGNLAVAPRDSRRSACGFAAARSTELGELGLELTHGLPRPLRRVRSLLGRGGSPLGRSLRALELLCGLPDSALGLAGLLALLVRPSGEFAVALRGAREPTCHRVPPALAGTFGGRRLGRCGSPRR